MFLLDLEEHIHSHISFDFYDDILMNSLNTIIIKDIEERQKRKEKDPNKRKITDVTLLKNISKFNCRPHLPVCYMTILLSSPN